MPFLRSAVNNGESETLSWREDKQLPPNIDQKYFLLLAAAATADAAAAAAAAAAAEKKLGRREVTQEKNRSL